jgi:hypothetical protein
MSKPVAKSVFTKLLVALVALVLAHAAPAYAIGNLGGSTPYPTRIVNRNPNGGTTTMRTWFSHNGDVHRQVTDVRRANGVRARHYYIGPSHNATTPFVHVDRQYRRDGSLRRVTVMRFNANGERLSTTRVRLDHGERRTTTTYHDPPAGIPSAH